MLDWFRMNFKKGIEIFKSDKRLQILLAVIVIGVLTGGFLIYYNSEGQVMARLSKENPRGSEFTKTIAESKLKLKRQNLKPQEKIQLLLDMAVARAALGDSEGAIKNYEEILQIDVSYPLAHSNLASLYVQNGKYREAEYQYLAIIAVSPSLSQPYLNLVDLYQGYLKEKENLVPAVLTYAIDKNGYQTVYLEKFAQYYYDKQMYDLAMQKIDQLLTVDPENQLGNALKQEIEKKS